MAPDGEYGHEPRGTVSATLALRGARRESIAELLPAKRIEAVLDECDPLCGILGKSVATAKGKRRKNDESGGDAGRT